ncbi:MAG: hypothetical protein K9K38_22940 [Rhodoferax sp.]|nr:hypothetical protein [Rhodoferax sp.]
MQLRSFTNSYALRLLDLLVVLGSALLIASLLGIEFLLSRNLPTGGDAASHLLYVWLYAKELLPNGHVTALLPEVFAGFPFLSYYFPLSFISIAGLATLLPFASAMKIGMFACAMFLPSAVWLGGVYLLRLPRAIAIWGVLASLAFLLHEQNSIWGGNLLSTLAGEFAYSYGVFFSLLTLFAWQRAIATGTHWWLAALLEAATGFSHGFALLIVGFATTAFLFDWPNFWRNLRLLVLGHGLAFLLLAGWLWPMFEMHSITIPNDALFEVTRWQDLLPRAVWPVLVAGLTATVLLGVIQSTPVLRRLLPVSIEMVNAQRHAAFLGSAGLLAATGFLAGSSIGVANIRFFPFVWLFGGVACGWLWGILLVRIALAIPVLARWGLGIMGAAAAMAFFSWVSLQIVAAPDWGLWNHSGLEAKPQWQRLSQLFPTLSGKLDSPRLTFEHDPANTDIGSTRALEALPMFLGGRPVLEGLYMESSLVGPAIYQLQSEVSRAPSSPLARFPSGSLDPEMAAVHMNFLYANQVLTRSDEAYNALLASKNFTEVASAPPFRVLKVNHFNTHWVDLADRPLRWLPKERWMDASFEWFRSRQKFGQELPVFYDGAAPQIAAAPENATLHGRTLERHRLSWRTDAVGAAHLVRMAWHPRWQLATKGKLYMAGPGFMLVVPEEANVVLEYGHTSVGYLGMVATLLSFFALFYLVWRQRQAGQGAAPFSTTWPGHWVAGLWPVLLIGLGLWLHLNNAERIYSNAWVSMRANQPLAAAADFDAAFAGRTSNAKKEEALFWSAKAYEQAGQREAALQRYTTLTKNYHGYWLAESLYTQAQLERASGATAQAEQTGKRLLLELPSSPWAQRLAREAK